MAMFNRSKLKFMKLFLVFIVLLTSSISIAQTKELGITTTELNGLLNSALRNSAGSNPQADSLTKIILTGEAAGDRFGYSVSTAGDVNGDGYSDVIVGAGWNAILGEHTGRSYIYYGGTLMDNTADVIMTGEAEANNFGESVSTAGDVNGDGYSDVIVGAYANDAGGINAGRSYIYYGGTSMDNIADVIMTGVAAYDNFGHSVSTAGDVNGDGYSDVIVGAFWNDAGGYNSGRSYIYFGGTSMDNAPDVIMTGEAAEDRFGLSVSTAGDVNGDGYSDVIVGAILNDAGGYNTGRSYIYFGGITMDNSADVTMTGEAAGDQFGYSVSTAGDVNGDGYSDVIVGGYFNDGGGDNAGRSYIYFGGTSMDNTIDITMTGEAANNHFGISVSTAGDVNGDGYSDVIVGARYNDAGGDAAGRSYIYFGGTTMDNTPDITMTGEATGDYFGQSVSTAGDVNGDGYSDVIVGADYNDAGGTHAGRAYLYLSSIPSLPPWSNLIVVEDAGGIESSEVLTFGQQPDATDSIDSSLGEYELPPPPFPGNFDARFNLPTNPEMGSLIDLRDSSLAEITWKLTFQPGIAGYPMTFSWDSTSFPDGTFYLKDRIGGSYVFVNMKNQSSYTLTEPAITSLNINYKGECTLVSVNSYWNMLSVPVLAEDMALSNLFITATSSAYGYEGGYVMEDTLATGVGYWLKFGGDEEIQICGALLGDTVQVYEGWNMFGAYEEDILVNQLTTTPPGIIATYFFGFEDGYYIADTLKSGKGHWVRVTEDGVINLGSGALSKDDGKQIAKIEKEWGRIKITDNEGKGITLYAAEEETESEFYELPPMPPSGIFDARYGNGKFVEDLRNSQVIRISSDNYPITIRAEGLNITVRDRINGNLLNEELTSGEEIRITNNKITSIEITGKVTGGLPVSYELSQNYPNPFNPSTTIKFALPQESKVNLTVFNILGEEVGQLINQEMKAGYHQIEFNASHYASGVYLYRIKAGDFVETKKMVLLK